VQAFQAFQHLNGLCMSGVIPQGCFRSLLTHGHCTPGLSAVVTLCYVDQ